MTKVVPPNTDAHSSATVPPRRPTGATAARTSPGDARPAGPRAAPDIDVEAVIEKLLAGLALLIAKQRVRDPDLLALDDVAIALRCSTDTVRRISASALPFYRVGKSNLYFREDLLAFVRAKGVAASKPADANREKQINPAVEKEVGEPPAVDRFVSEMLGLSTVDASTPAERRAE